MLTIYLANKYIKAAVGEMSGGKLHVREMVQTVDEGGAILNGTIVDEEALLALLKNLWEEHNLPKKDVNLVLDSNQFTSKEIQVPVLNSKKTMDYVIREFTGVERITDPVYGYFELEKPDKKSKLQKVLAMAAPRDYVLQFIELFRKLGITLSGVECAAGARYRLLKQLTSLEGKACIIQFVDDMNLTNILQYNGSIETSNRKRLFAEPGTPAYIVEIARATQNLISFAKAQNLDNMITDVFVSGITEADYEIYEDSIRNINPDLAVELLTAGKNITISKNEDNFAGYAIAMGGLIKTDPDTNIASGLKYTPEQLESRKQKRKILIPSVTLAVVLAVAALILLGRNLYLQSQLDDLKAYNQDPEIVQKCEEYEALNARIAAATGISNGLSMLTNTLEQYPKVDSKVEAVVENCAVGLVTATIRSYSAKTGLLQMETKARDVSQINQFVNLLTKQEIFASVDYTGYNEDSNGTWTVNVNCIMAPEQIEEEETE